MSCRTTTTAASKRTLSEDELMKNSASLLYISGRRETERDTHKFANCEKKKAVVQEEDDGENVANRKNV